MRRAASEYSGMMLKSMNSTPTPSTGEMCGLLSSNIGVVAHLLPCFDSPRDAIKRISPMTMTRVLAGEFAHLHNRLLIVDCRYPYEYHGGHIPGATNVCDLDTIDRVLFHEANLNDSHADVIIFHCEFSSERAPRMALHVRNLDRMSNAENYPHLHYPQIYVLDGGYKNFFIQYPGQCEPPGQYVPMRNAGHRDELRHHQRLKFQDGNAHGKHRHKLRSCSLRKAHSLAMPLPVSGITSFFRTREPSPAATPPATVADLLSSDLGDIYDQADGFMQAAEDALLAMSTDNGRLSK